MDFETIKKSKGPRGRKLVRWAILAVVIALLAAGGYHLYQGPLGDIVRTHLQKAQGE